MSRRETRAVALALVAFALVGAVSAELGLLEGLV